MDTLDELLCMKMLQVLTQGEYLGCGKNKAGYWRIGVKILFRGEWDKGAQSLLPAFEREVRLEWRCPLGVSTAYEYF